jgi:2-oxoacid:acceptor oxidoreductase gamma subunit (pyruvate/2-ketoisovalerate family)
MREIRLHGRGGQGVVLAAEMLAKALVSEGKHVASFPMFGVERRGAPIAAYLRFDEKPIREKTQIYYPDCLIVADPIMKTWPAVFSGLKDEAVLILNTSIQEEGKPHGNVKTMGVVNASRIALEETGRTIPNTCIVGAFVGTTGWLQLDSLLACFHVYFQGDMLERNIKCAQRGFHEVAVRQFKKRE